MQFYRTRGKRNFSINYLQMFKARQFDFFCQVRIRHILTASHLLGEEGDQLCEVDGAGGLCQHVGGIAVRDRLADVGEGSLEGGGEMPNGPCRTQQLLNWQKMWLSN